MSSGFICDCVGHTKSVILLLERGAKLACRNKYGNTLLHVAAMNGHTDMLLFLLDKGQKLTTKNNAGSTPLHYAGSFEVLSLWPYASDGLLHFLQIKYFSFFQTVVVQNGSKMHLWLTHTWTFSLISGGSCEESLRKPVQTES